VISSSQRPLPENTQHLQQTNIHATGGIRTYNPSKRAAVDLRLRPRGQWDGPPSKHNYKSNQQYATIRVNSLFLLSSTCFGQCFRP